MLPTTVSTAATTRSLVVTVLSKRSVMVRAARSTETSLTPGIFRQPAAISLRQVRHISSVISTVTSPSEADATMTGPGSPDGSFAPKGAPTNVAGDGLPGAHHVAQCEAERDAYEMSHHRL